MQSHHPTPEESLKCALHQSKAHLCDAHRARGCSREQVGLVGGHVCRWGAHAIRGGSAGRHAIGVGAGAGGGEQGHVVTKGDQLCSHGCCTLPQFVLLSLHQQASVIDAGLAAMLHVNLTTKGALDAGSKKGKRTMHIGKHMLSQS